MKRMPHPERLVPFLRAARLQGCLLRLHLSDYSSYVLLIDSHQRLPRRPLRRVPRRAFPRGACRARRRVLHPGRVERRAPAALVIPRELKVVALTRQPPLANLISGRGSVNGFSTLLLPVRGDRRSPALHRAFRERARLRAAASCGAHGVGAVRCGRLSSFRSRSLLTLKRLIRCDGPGRA
jgi:hypothetical protein